MFTTYSSSSKSLPKQHEDDPFLYFSLLTNQADGKFYAFEHSDDDGSDSDIKPEISTRQRSFLLATEVHPLHESLLDAEEEELITKSQSFFSWDTNETAGNLSSRNVRMFVR